MVSVIAAHVVHAPARDVRRIVGVGDALVDGRILAHAVRSPVLDVVEVVDLDRSRLAGVAVERGLEDHLIVRPVQIGPEILPAIVRFIILADDEQDLAPGVGERHPRREVGDTAVATGLDVAHDTLVPPSFIGVGGGVLIFHMHEQRLARMLLQETHEAVEHLRKQKGRQLLPTGRARRITAAGRIAQHGDAVMNRKVLYGSRRRAGTQVEHADARRQLLLDGKFLRLGDFRCVGVA